MKKNAERLSWYKVILSILSGWVAILLAQYPLIIDSIYDTQFSWFLLFPMLTVSAFGFPYVYITGFLGLVVILPFMQYPRWGIANLLFSVLYLMLLCICGKMSQKKKLGQYYFIFVIYALFFYCITVTFFRVMLEWNFTGRGLIRFASPMVVRIQTITTVFGIFALAAIVKVLLELPVLRTIFKMPQLTYSQKNTKLFCIAILIAAMFLTVDGLFESFYFKSRGVHTFLFFSSFGSLLKFPIVLATGCMICDAIINNTMNNLRAQDKLMKSEERYRMIFQHMADACFEIDKSGMILNYNPTVKYLGISTDDIKFAALPKLFSEEKKIEELVEMLFHENHVEDIEMSSIMADGKERRLLISGNVMEYEEQQLAVLTVRDITAQKKAEQEIVELNAGLEQTVEERTKSLNMAYSDLESFSYTLIHELKTPIREIDTYLEIIKEDNFDTLINQSQEDIISAQKVCMRTLDMIEKMMIYTRAGFITLNIEKIDLRQMVEACFNSLRQANMDKNIELHISELPCLYADSFLMQVAVMNVLSNSIKFSMSKEKIVLEVSYQYRDDKLIYIFKDNGVGFEKNSAVKLFKLFYRAHNNSEYDGNGVGLALVRRIVERHGGNVSISGIPNEGCIVSFLFSKDNETREFHTLL